MLSTPDRQPYVEIQGWPDQRPVHQARIASRREKESRRILDTDRSSFGYLFLKGSGIKASPIDRIPLFDWARKNESSIWIALADAYKNKSMLPAAPYPEDGQWAPSGMEDLDDAFRWAIQISPRSERDYWQFHYGTWLAGRERVEEAIEQLSIPDIDLAKALLARLYVRRQAWEKARDTYAAIPETSWLNLHPQLVIERDKVLKKFGTEALSEREKWLDKINASSDEWVVERKVQLLIDKKQYQEAKDLLLSTHFPESASNLHPYGTLGTDQRRLGPLPATCTGTTRRGSLSPVRCLSGI